MEIKVTPPAPPARPFVHPAGIPAESARHPPDAALARHRADREARVIRPDPARWTPDPRS